MGQLDRAQPTAEYVTNVTEYLTRRYPELRKNFIEDFVKEESMRRLVRPKAKIIKHENFNSEVIEVDLLTHLNNNRKNVISPSGSCYLTADVQQAPDIAFLQSRMDLRNQYRNEMLELFEQGQNVLANLANLKQGSAKITNNSVPGATGTEFSIMFDLENFNSITGISRHTIMGAYVFTERFLSHNMWFLSLDEVYNHLIVTLRHCPSKFYLDEIIEKYELYVPCADEMIDSLLHNMQKYFHIERIPPKMSQFVETLKRHEIAFVAYHMNLWYMLKKNPHIFKQWAADTLNVEEIKVDPNIKVECVTDRFEKTLIQLMSIVCGDIIGEEIIGDIHVTNPEMAKRVLTIGEFMENQMEKIHGLFEAFLFPRCTIPGVSEQKNLSRDVTVISDTDSIIFTALHIVNYFLGKGHEFDEGIKYANLAVYWLAKGLKVYFAKMCEARGATEEDVPKMKIDNEYMFPIFVRTDISKHYFAIQTAKDGKPLPEPILELKGLNFKSSTLPAITNNFTEQLIKDILDDLLDDFSLDLGEYLERIMEYEYTVYESLIKGELDYVGTVSIKDEAEYKDASRTIYKNYEFWEHLLADKYGSIRIPLKAHTIPIIERMWDTERYQDWVSTINKPFANRIKELPKKDRRNPGRMPMSADCLRIPDELIPCTDIRKTIHRNLSPAYLVMKSFEVDLNDYSTNKRLVLLSDIYCPIKDLI